MMEKKEVICNWMEQKNHLGNMKCSTSHIHKYHKTWEKQKRKENKISLLMCKIYLKVIIIEVFSQMNKNKALYWCYFIILDFRKFIMSFWEYNSISDKMMSVCSPNTGGGILASLILWLNFTAGPKIKTYLMYTL